ncbi:hypothetical protein NL676_015038 [Syzygium grande]|nr:hypothetical protein NL676_015038 [Syzygium grande]
MLHQNGMEDMVAVPLFLPRGRGGWHDSFFTKADKWVQQKIPSFFLRSGQRGAAVKRNLVSLELQDLRCLTLDLLELVFFASLSAVDGTIFVNAALTYLQGHSHAKCLTELWQMKYFTRNYTRCDVRFKRFRNCCGLS